jgi:hypothetical protein
LSWVLHATHTHIRVTPGVERPDHSSIEIDFEDKSRHRRPMQFVDPWRCTMVNSVQFSTHVPLLEPNTA